MATKENVPSELKIHMLAVRLIDDPEWNSRLNIKDDKELAALADSMATTGLLNPITVADAGSVHVKAGESKSSYTLVAGSRRFAAAKKLGWETIPAFIRLETTQLDRVVINVGENALRKDLTTFEMARACTEMRDQNAKSGEAKLTVAEIGRRAGLSAQRVSQLTVAYATLPQAIKDRWKTEGAAQDEGVRVLTAPFLNELVQLKDPDAQLKAFRERLARMEAVYAENKAKNPKGKGKSAKGGKGKGKDKGKDEGGVKGPSGFNVSVDRYNAVLKAVHGHKTAKQIIEVMNFLVGKSNDMKSLGVVVNKPGKLTK